MRKGLTLKIIFSFFIILLFVLKVFFEIVDIDFIDVCILILAILPWIIDRVESLEINGVGKVELINKNERVTLEQYAKEENIKENVNSGYSFSNLRYSDPKLSLAGMRIEIETTLKEIAHNNKLDVKNPTIRNLTETLSRYQLISSSERAVIFDLIGILNRAVHNDISEYQINDLDWVWDLGIKLLNSLKERVKER